MLPPQGDTLHQDFSSGRHRPLHLLAIALVEQEDRMDVAIAGMGDVDNANLVLPADFGRAANDLRQSGPRHHAVLKDVAWAEPAGSADGRLAALPEQSHARGWKMLAALLGRRHRLQNSTICCCCRSRPAGGPIDLDHQHRAGVRRKAELEGRFHGLEDPLVHQFHRRGDNAAPR